MKKGTGFGFLQYGILVTLLLCGLFAYNLFMGDRHLFLPGQTTHGHHQIELKCEACHVESFKAGEPMQEACMSCHSEPMKQARDKHPKKKFTDPRNADLLSNLDATKCVTCHIEHSPEITDENGVTLPEDFCFYCHKDIVNERPSHKTLEFDSCGNSGCHNYHDNRALYEKFLQKNIDQPHLLSVQKTFTTNGLSVWKKRIKDVKALMRDKHDGGNIDNFSTSVVEQWELSAHAQSGVNCSACHDNSVDSSTTELTVESCSECHEHQVNGFKEGLHGMTLAAEMKPMKVSEARLDMQTEALHLELTCGSCHDPHNPDLKIAAVVSCQGCHNDQHTNNYASSKHAALFEKELNGKLKEGEGVSCASCHMPRKKKGKLVFVEHNQSLNLKPNSKILRSVCMNCHGLEYATAALADKSLITRNFSGDFVTEHPSFDMVRARMKERDRIRKEKSVRSRQ